MKKFAMPPVGSQVTVTTRYRDSYYYSDQEYQDTTYTGVVTRPESWFRPDWFSITNNNERVPRRVISMENVIDLKIGGEVAEHVDTDNIIKSVPVKGSKGNEYVVTLKNKLPINCSCVGFQVRKKCKHLSLAIGL